jgi:predicted nucleic acid-binding protein
VTDAEVLQEIVHHYRAVRAWSQGRALFSEFAALMQGRVEAIHGYDVERAAELVDRYPSLGTRDLLHLAVMFRLSARQIVSTDHDFDAVPEVERLDPLGVDAWAARLA